MNDEEMQLLHLCNLMSACVGLEQAVGDQKPEIIALYTGKILAAVNKCREFGTVDELTLARQQLIKH